MLVTLNSSTSRAVCYLIFQLTIFACMMLGRHFSSAMAKKFIFHSLVFRMTVKNIYVLLLNTLNYRLKSWRFCLLEE